MTSGRQLGAAVRLGRQLANQPDLDTDWELQARGLEIRSRTERIQFQFPDPITPSPDQTLIVDNRDLAKASRDLNDQEFSFTVGQQGRAVINGVTLPSVVYWSGASIPELGSDLVQAGKISAENIKSLSPFAATGDRRPTLACLHYGPEGLSATDTYRLARISTEQSAKQGLIPGAIATLLAKSAAAPIEVWFGPDRIFELRTTTRFGLTVSYCAAAPEGTFPTSKTLWDQAPAEPFIEAQLTEGAAEQFEKLNRWAEPSGQPAVLVAVDDQVSADLPGRGATQAQVSPAPIADQLQRVGQIETVFFGASPAFLAQISEFFAGQAVKVRIAGPDKPALFLSPDRLLLLAPVQIKNWP